MDASAPSAATDFKVAALVARAAELVQSRPLDADTVAAWVAAFDALPARSYARFDDRCRMWRCDLNHDDVAALRHRSRWRTRPDQDSADRLWRMLGTVSADGYQREAALREVELGRGASALILIRATDWVEQVRSAAIERSAGIPVSTLIDLLPLCDQLTTETRRASLPLALLQPISDERLLHEALHHPAFDTRVVAWRWLAERDAIGNDAYRDHIAQDRDPAVRGLASERLPRLPEAVRAEVARVLVSDPVAGIALRALTALVELHGRTAIVDALASARPAVRRRAQALATLTQVDARKFYLDRLTVDEGDVIGALGLCELASEDDAEQFALMLDDARGRVRRAAMRALSFVDPDSGRFVALAQLEAGGSARATRAAARVLALRPLSRDELLVAVRVASDPTRADGERVRALGLLRSARWLHLSVLVEVYLGSTGRFRRTMTLKIESWIANSATVTSPPPAGDADRLLDLIPALPGPQRERLEFILRTAAP